MDEYTIKREYLKLTCQRSTNKQDQDFMIVHFEVLKWPHAAVTYQFLMECLELKQGYDQRYNEPTVDKIKLMIRKQAERFSSEKNFEDWLRQSNVRETFLAQDLNRWKNQNFVCSVFNPNNNQDFLIEAVSCDKPAERAYLRVASLNGFRGKLLTQYIDKALEIVGADISDDEND